jgi:hypothetical protein
MKQKGLVTKVKDKYFLIINFEDNTFEGIELTDNLEAYKDLKETQVVLSSVEIKDVDEEKQEITITDLYLISILKDKQEDTMENLMNSEYFSDFISSVFQGYNI